MPESDALFGEFPLHDDWFDIIDRWHDDADIEHELCEIVTTARPVLEWLLLVAERVHLIGEQEGPGSIPRVEIYSCTEVMTGF
ncbi:hypothetical protein R1CP_32325 [Rhodococcus opacus]|uniref:Uncharacterized protein n=1 Tax=Rhodococcus opacus TaxID=37919 RepID=A0A1B1KES2_RHOOP|nr:hypothetical protein [Rhodococcus opacus]ANS31088.1 hypothetical protein R1CP_32325 [Rhodococcus opacus]